MTETRIEPTGPEKIRDLDASSWDPVEILGDEELQRPIPLKALVLSFAALLVPILTALVFPSFSSGDTGLLIWLTALIPAFLLTYYRGWSGASLALAMYAPIPRAIPLATAPRYSALMILASSFPFDTKPHSIKAAGQGARRSTLNRALLTPRSVALEEASVCLCR